MRHFDPNKKTLLLPAGVEGGGKSGVIAAARDVGCQPLISFCCNINDIEPTRKPRQSGEDRLFINTGIMTELEKRGCILSRAMPESYGGNVIYLYLSQLPQELIPDIANYNQEFGTRYQVDYFTNERREMLASSGSLQSITDRNQIPVLEFDPPGVLDFAGRLKDEYNILIPAVFGVGLQALVEAQVRREEYTLENCPPETLNSYKMKARDSFWSGSPHIWDILREGRDSPNFSAFPIPNFGSFEDYENLLVTFKDALKLLTTDLMAANSLREGVYDLTKLKLDIPKNSEVERIGGGFGNITVYDEIERKEITIRFSPIQILDLFKFAYRFHTQQDDELKIEAHRFERRIH